MIYYNLFILTKYNNPLEYMELETLYNKAKNTPSDINEHIETLYKYSLECSSIAELGVRGMVSTWAFIKGLADSNNSNLRYYGFDLIDIDSSIIDRLCFENNINNTNHFKENDLLSDITNETYDMVFIDTMHNYPHCYEELCKFSPHTTKYIILHDTTIDGITSEYVRLEFDTRHYETVIKHYDNKYTEEEFKMGIMFAIGRFIEENPQWDILESYSHNNGLTILKCNQ